MEHAVKLSESIKPISYLKSHAAEVIGAVAAEGKTFIITQHGEAKAILQGIASYEQTHESFALLKLLAQSNHSLEEGRTKPAGKVLAELKRLIAERRK